MKKISFLEIDRSDDSHQRRFILVEDDVDIKKEIQYIKKQANRKHCDIRDIQIGDV